MSCLITTEVKKPERTPFEEKNLASKGKYNMVLSIDKWETRSEHKVKDGVQKVTINTKSLLKMYIEIYYS